MKYLKAFLAGFLATLCFHQPVVWLLHLAHVAPRGPYNMQPVPPLGIPSVISLAFWGGVWGIIMVLAIGNTRKFVLWSIPFGAVLPTLVAVYVAAPLKHKPIVASPTGFLIGFAVNAAWGLGTALLYRFFIGKH